LKLIPQSVVIDNSDYFLLLSTSRTRYRNIYKG
jgi:hypothetical protein